MATAGVCILLLLATPTPVAERDTTIPRAPFPEACPGMCLAPRKDDADADAGRGGRRCRWDEEEEWRRRTGDEVVMDDDTVIVVEWVLLALLPRRWKCCEP